MELAAIHYTYDYQKIIQSSVDNEEFWEDPEVRIILLHQQVDYHKWNHRPSLFKKGPECRFNFGRKSWSETVLGIEYSADDGLNITTWYCLNESSIIELIESTPYLVETKQPMGCKFLNTHNVTISTVFGSNTNV